MSGSHAAEQPVEAIGPVELDADEGRTGLPIVLLHVLEERDELRQQRRQMLRDIRRLLIIGASTVVKYASLRGAPEGSWLAGMLARKPRMLISVAQANKTARIVWAVLASGQEYRDSAAA